MGAACKDLQKFGFKAFERKDCRQTFLTQVVELKVMSIADDYWFRFLARIKSIAVSVGALPRLPWEAILFGAGEKLASLPVAAKLPMELLADNRNAREACIDLMPKDLHLSMSEMVSQVQKRDSVLLGLCKDFAQEIAFLTQRADALGEQHVRSEVIALMPLPDVAEVDVAAVVAALRVVKAKPLVMALSAKFKIEVENALSFLVMIAEGAGPKDSAAFCTPFLQQVMDLAKNFYQVRAKNDNEVGANMLLVKVLTGAEAARHDLASFREALQAEGADIGPFATRLRRFAWLTSAAEQQEVNDAVKDKLKRRRNELMAPLAIQDSAAQGATDGKRAKSAASSKGGGMPTALENDLLDDDIPAVKVGGGKNSKNAAANSAEVSDKERKRALSSLFKKKVN